MNKRVALCVLLLVVAGALLSAEPVFLGRRILVDIGTKIEIKTKDNWHYLRIENVYTKNNITVLQVRKVIEDIYDIYTVRNNDSKYVGNDYNGWSTQDYIKNNYITRLGTATLYTDTSHRAFYDGFVSLVYNRIKEMAQQDEPKVWLDNIDQITTLFVQYVAENHLD
jgi:hypothetical protein